MTAHKTMEQKRASYALSKIQEVMQSDFQGKYSSYARKLPTMIVSNGFGPTLAFIKSKSSGESMSAQAYETLYQHLNDWQRLRQLLGLTHANDDLLDSGILGRNATSSSYRLATMEALKLAEWLKRFSEAYLKKEEETE
ncbi:MAG: type III-B CRISPR module-associated protein Cmr5 [bacterium JZ-2024 1]